MFGHTKHYRTLDSYILGDALLGKMVLQWFALTFRNVVIDRSIETNAIKIDYSSFEAIVIKNDDTREYKKEKWKNRECFRGKHIPVLTNLNGLVLWYISFNTAKGRTIYDVYNNTFTDVSPDGEGFSHTIILPGLA